MGCFMGENMSDKHSSDMSYSAVGCDLNVNETTIDIK